MTEIKTELLKNTMSKAYWHQKWVETYINASKELYDLAFDKISKVIWSSDKNLILDAGCGNGVNTIRLLNRGFDVVSIDFSEEALELCKKNLIENKLLEVARIEKADLLNLDFDDSTFDSVLCWGVLMHIHEIELALQNLCRVIKLGGFLVICEVSQNALDTLIGKTINRITKTAPAQVKKAKFGIENWSVTDAGSILVRKTNMKVLKQYLKSSGFDFIGAFPGQFTQSYTRIRNHKLKKIVLGYNKFWFKHIKIVNPSVEQVLIFKKSDDCQKN